MARKKKIEIEEEQKEEEVVIPEVEEEQPELGINHNGLVYGCFPIGYVMPEDAEIE